MENKFTYKQMQEMLPDYVFNRLSLEESRLFEDTLPAYPDLIDEVNQVKEVFGRLEEMDLDTEIADRTRNLSVRVQNRLGREKSGTRFGMIIRYAVPMLAIAVIAVLTFTNNTFLGRLEEGHKQGIAGDVEVLDLEDPGYVVISPVEASVMFDEELSEDDYLQIASGFGYTKSDAVLAELAYDHDAIEMEISSMLKENLEDVSPDDLNKLYPPTGTSMDIMEEFDKLDESELQEILEEIENAEIAS